jgi:protein-S-isoprenylcysteine O-methyltransferase Ste14
MQASDFEFRNRWYVIGGVFFGSFIAYFVDPVNAGTAIVDWIARRTGSTAGDNSYRWIFAVAAALMLIAALLRTWGTAYLQADVMRDSRLHTDKLVADGPYRRVRNPLYLGNIIMAVAIGLMASRVGFVLLVVGMTVFVLRLLMREEHELVHDQGEAYRSYCEAVPRLLPAMVPRVAAAGHAAHWGQAFRAELMYWLMTAALAVFAVTLNIKLFWGLFALAMGTAFFYKGPAAGKASERR